MSHPAIGIGHRMSHPPPVARPRISCAPHVRPADPEPHGAVFRIPHTPYGIRNSEFGIPESGIGKSGIMVRSSRPIQAVLF
jgi:hypothetical protein